MTAAEIQAECREIADRLSALSEEFAEVIKWDRHSRELLSMASHLAIYAHQLDGKK